MCVHNFCSHMPQVDGINAAEENLLFFCKPVELYNVLRRRAISNPFFLKRCLRYDQKAIRKRRRINDVVIFNYKDPNNIMRKVEVTEKFSCPFCLVQCESFKGMRLHLNSSHDLFSYDFWMSEDYQAVNVALKCHLLRSESFSEVKQHEKPFVFCSNKRRRGSNLAKAKEIQLQFFEFDTSKLVSECTTNVVNSIEENINSAFYKVEAQDVTRTMENHLSGGPELLEHVASSSDTPPELHPENEPPPFHVARSRKLTNERSDSKVRAFLQKRQFYHSHRVQPMAVEQVMSDQDSEDEVDNEVADLEDRRMLDDFVDVSKEEKQLMHLWNSFVRKQRVIADGHVPWACEAFSKLHGRFLLTSTSLFWCWRLLMVKLWNHGLLDAASMNTCNSILNTMKGEVTEVDK